MTPEQRERERERARRAVADVAQFAVVAPRTPWSPDEDATVLAWTGTLVDLALHLGRTYGSVASRRTDLLARLAAED